MARVEIKRPMHLNRETVCAVGDVVEVNDGLAKEWMRKGWCVPAAPMKKAPVRRRSPAKKTAKKTVKK